MTRACCPGCTHPHPLLAWVMSWHCLARRRWSQNLNSGQPDSRACVLKSASCCILLKVCVWTGEPFVKPTFCADLFLGRSSMSWNPFEVALCSWAEGDSLRCSGLAISKLIRKGPKTLLPLQPHPEASGPAPSGELRVLPLTVRGACVHPLSLDQFQGSSICIQILLFLSRGSCEQMAIPLKAPAFFPGLMWTHWFSAFVLIFLSLYILEPFPFFLTRQGLN